MSRLFGSMRQIAFVVHDLDRALRYWTDTLGVGPFFRLPRLTPENYRYRGKPSPSPVVSIALGNSGEVQVELIQQHDDRPSAYRDFLAAGREGLQHVSSWLTRAEYDTTRSRLLAAGTTIVHAFATTRAEFDHIFRRVRDAGLEYGDSFDAVGNMRGPGDYGARGPGKALYLFDPSKHLIEIRHYESTASCS